MNKFILSSLLIVGMSTAAFAQTQTSFRQLDADSSGELSFAELQVAWPNLTQDNFDAADADRSGGLSISEMATVAPPSQAAPSTPPPVFDNPASLSTN